MRKSTFAESTQRIGTRAVIFILWFSMLAIPLGRVVANTNGIAPVEMATLLVDEVSLDPLVLDIRFAAQTTASGEYTTTLHLPPELSTRDGSPLRETQFIPASGTQVARQWNAVCARDGYYMLQVLLTLDRDVSQKPDPMEPAVATFHAVVHYLEVVGGRLVASDPQPDERFDLPVQEVEPKPGAMKSIPTYIEPPVSARDAGPSKGIGRDANYTIYVSIQGKLNFLHGQECYSSEDQGIPNTRIWLDWDYDHNSNTGFTPYASESQHVGYDISQMDGSYYFSFYFQSSVPANEISDRIRVYAYRNNGAAFNGNFSYGGYLPVMAYIDISTATTYVWANSADLTQDPNDGGALRNIYRAKLFCQSELGLDPPGMARYYIRPGCSSSFYCSSGGINCDDCGPNPGVSYILYNRYPDAELCSHEYGHWIDHYANDNLYGASGSHSFAQVTTYSTAWVEGWAEFFQATVNMYWYGIEMDGYYEGASFDGYYAFLEETEGDLPVGVDRRKVEGAVACFMHALWDGTDARALGYDGDNDNVEIPGGVILVAACEAETMAATYGIDTILAWFESLVKYHLSSAVFHDSIDKLYEYYVEESLAAPLSATPDYVAVSGTNKRRMLNWNDKTSVQFAVLTGGDDPCVEAFWPERHNEGGFNVYRKAGDFVWDGTLVGFSLVHSAGTDVLSWTDSHVQSSAFKYVVVATSPAGESVPIASAQFGDPPVATISGPSKVYRGIYYDWTSSVTGGTTPYTYAWYRRDGSDCNATDSWVPIGSGSSLHAALPMDCCLKLIATGANGAGGETGLRVTVTIPPDHSPPGFGEVAGGMSGGGVEGGVVAALNYPNPLNPESTIRLALPSASAVRLRLYDVIGRLVGDRNLGMLERGKHDIQVSGALLSSGVYLCKIDACGEVVVVKVAVVK